MGFRLNVIFHRRLTIIHNMFVMLGIILLFKQPQDANSDDLNNQGNENLPPRQSLDIEDIAGKQPSSAGRPVATKRKRGQMSLEKSLSKGNSSQQSDGQLSELSKSWKEVLGEPPKWGPNKV